MTRWLPCAALAVLVAAVGGQAQEGTRGVWLRPSRVFDGTSIVTHSPFQRISGGRELASLYSSMTLARRADFALSTSRLIYGSAIKSPRKS